MERFEKALEKETHIEQAPEELQEKVAKGLIFGILDNEMKYLSLPETSEIINKVIGRENASESLAGTIKTFSEKLAGQEIKIRPGNSVEDILDNTSMCLFAFVDRARKRGMEERYIKVIKEDFYSIEEYLKLLINHPEFEKAELGGKYGFLKESMTDEELDKIMSLKSDYVKRCKEMLEGKKESLDN